MSECNIDHSDYKNNGLITKIWGGPGWIFNHSVTFGYPLEPTEEQKLKYKNYFISLGDVLPCKYCRESYEKFIATGETALTNDVMENRVTLTKWFYRVHEAVNAKLEIDYGITYDDLTEKYESFRAKCGKTTQGNGCVAPLDYKAFSFRKMYYFDAPIVSIEMVKPFIEIAKIRKLDNKYSIFLNLAQEYNGDFTKLKKLDSWYDRNKFCQQQIKYMRENAVPSIEENGPWQGMPTLDELKLLMFLSSNLNRTQLRNATNKFNKIFVKKNNLIY